MKTSASIVALVLGMLFFAAPGFAAGFRLPDQDAAAMGMAGAFVGQADDPAAVWYNPAGITQLDGTRISGGAVAIYPVNKHESAGGPTDVAERKVHLPFHLFATSKINDAMTVGLGITNPFGLSSTWSDTSATRYVATFSEVKTLNINPTIAYRINDALSVAAGVNYLQLEATMDKMLPTPFGDRSFSLKGDGVGWGVNAAVKYAATDRTSFGLSYRSRIKVSMDGTASVDLQLPAPSNSAKTSITLPDLVQIGTSYKATDDLLINVDLEYTGWSSYDKLVVTSDSILALSGGATDTSREDKKWKNTWMVRIGGQYKVSEQWKLRAGYVFDASPVPEKYFDTRVPDSNRHGVTIGTGYTSGRITIDAAYLYLVFANRTITNSVADDATPTPAALTGTYKSLAHIAGVTLGYKF